MPEQAQEFLKIPPYVVWGLYSTLLLSLINLYITFRQSRKSSFVNTVTSERIKWMEKLRGYITDYLTLVEIYDQKTAVEAGEKRSKHLDKISKLDKKIRLQLNYQGVADNEIIDLVNKITSASFELYKKIELLEKTPSEKLKYFLLSNQSNLEGKLKEAAEMYIRGIDTGIYEPNPNLIDKIIQNLTYETVDELIMEQNKKMKKEFDDHLITIRNSADALLKKTQEYMKYEWNRVKKEAENGNIQRGWLSFKDLKTISQIPRWKAFKCYYDLHILMKTIITVLIIFITIVVVKYHQIIYEQIRLFF